MTLMFRTLPNSIVSLPRLLARGSWGICLEAQLALCAACLVFSPGDAQAQDVWEFTPYHNYAIVAFEQDPALTPAMQANLLRDLTEQADNVLGANWDMHVQEADADWTQAMPDGNLAEDPESVIQASLHLQDVRAAENLIEPVDKIFLVHISATALGKQVAVREFDVVTRTLSDAEVLVTPQDEVLSRLAFQALLTSFSPLARMEESDTEDIRLGLRAEGQPRRDASLQLVGPGDLFVPIIRQNNRDGSPRGIKAVPWTYLRVNAPAEPAAGAAAAVEPSPFVNATTFSALRMAFSTRRRGREEKYALYVRPRYDSTTVKVVNRTDFVTPLAGYEFISYTPDSPVTTLLGTTDPRGEIEVAADDAPLHLLLVRSGGRLLARLPLVPGVTKEMQIELADDRDRLRIEGFIAGLQEEIVGVFTHREILIRLARQKLENNDVTAARELVDRIKKLPSADSFRDRIRARRSNFVSADSSIQQHILKLFSDTEGVLARYLADTPVQELQSAIDQARPN